MNRRLFLAAAAAATAPLRGADAPFTTSLWAAIADVYAQTLRHPFLTGLRDGTLAESKFRFYLLQDSLYLGAFGKGLQLLAGKAPRKEWAGTLEKDAAEAVAVEKQMHAQILASFGVRAEPGLRMAPTNYAYTRHLLLHATSSPFGEGLAAMLPCYWIYWEVGKELIRTGSKKPAYQRWINQYAGEAYGASVRRVMAMLDAEAQRADRAVRKLWEEAFVTSSRYEYLFWDMAWREERWLP